MIENPWFLLAIFAGIASFSLWSERETYIGGKLGAVIIALGLGMILVNSGLIPAWSDIHSVVFSYAVPIAIPLFLFQADFRKIFKLGPKLLLAFSLGTIGTLIGAFIAGFTFNFGPEAWKAYGMFAGTYIGGSVNLASVGSGLNIDPSVWTAINAADIIVFFFWVAFLFNAGKWAFLKKMYPKYSALEIGVPKLNNEMSNNEKKNRTSIANISIVLGTAIVIAAIGEWMGEVTGIAGVIFSTTIALILAITTNISKISVAEDLAIWLMTLYFAVIGGLAIFKDVIAAGPIIFVGAATIIVVHGLVLLIGGRMAKLPLEYLLLASNANVGGPTTAAPMASMYGWRDLVLPGVLMGIAGYALGTYLGFGVAYLLRTLLI